MKKEYSEYTNHNNLKDKRIIITGVGYKPLEKTFYHRITSRPLHNPLFVNDQECKLNIGAAVALALAAEGATIHIVSRTEEKLKNIKLHICEVTGCDKSKVEYCVCDIANKKEVNKFVKSLPKDKTIYWVQSVGLGAGSYKLPGDNVYLLFKDVPEELPSKEADIVLRSTLLMMQALYPIFKKQKETRIVGISSMSAIRSYPGGYSHTAAKAAIHMALRTLAIELEHDNIFVTEVMPGIIDTGMYDKVGVIEAIKRMQKEHNRPYKNAQIPLAPPSSVADLVVTALKSTGHCLDLRIIGHKQWPWDGS